MRRLAHLLIALAEAPHHAARSARLEAYFKAAPPGDLGWATAWMTGALAPPRQTPAKLRAMAEARVGAPLFRFSAAQIGDVAETAALIWPGAGDLTVEDAALGLSDPAALFDGLDAEARVAAARRLCGRKAKGVRPAEVHAALAAVFGGDPGLIAGALIEEAPPYPRLFAWLTGGGPAPNWAPPRPPTLADTPDARADTHEFFAIPEGVPAAVAAGRAFDAEGRELTLNAPTEDGWGFWAGGTITPPDAAPLPEGPGLARSRATGEWSLLRPPTRTAICPVTFIEAGREVSVTLGVEHGDDLAPLVKLPCPDGPKAAAFARRAVVDKFGPVRQVGPGLWAEIAYDGARPAPRRKIGVALENPRITRLIWEDGPPTPKLGDLV